MSDDHSEDRRKLLELEREVWRRECRRPFVAFAVEALSGQGEVPAQHRRLMCSALQDVAEGHCKRLMVLAPPGSAKTTYVSRLFPAWYFAFRPRSSIIACSHTQGLSELNSHASTARASTVPYKPHAYLGEKRERKQPAPPPLEVQDSAALTRSSQLSATPRDALAAVVHEACDGSAAGAEAVRLQTTPKQRETIKRRFQANMRRISGLVSFLKSPSSGLEPPVGFQSEGVRADIYRSVVIYLHATTEDFIRNILNLGDGFTFNSKSGLRKALVVVG